MSTAATPAPVRGTANTRRVPRFPLAVPTDVIIVRAGTPQSIPGRSVTLGERGLGVVLAGELNPGDSVNLEFHLPDFGGRLKLNAVVRYQALMQCGLEFQGLTREQQKLIEHWARTRSVSNPNPAFPVAVPEFQDSPIVTPAVAAPDRSRQSARFRHILSIAVFATLLLSALGWWRWRRAWDELESQIPATNPLPQQAPAYVPAEVMQRLLTHKTEPIYPEAARQANVQGIVVLDTIIAPDGSVLDVHAISGPDELAPAAADAVKWWRFQPYQANGHAVEVETRLAVEFQRN